MPVSLTAFPQYLASQMGISLFASQLLVTSIFVMLFLGPLLILTRNKMAHLIMGFSIISFCVAMAWFPLWSFVLICIMIALFFSRSIIGRF